MLRTALVSLLNARRNNDVHVLIPLDTAPPLRLAVESVVYDPTSDVVLIRTEPLDASKQAVWFGRPDQADEDIRDAHPPVTREHEGWPAGRAARQGLEEG